MKLKLLLATGAVMLLPTIPSSAEYTRDVSAENVIVNRGGEVLLKPRSDLSKRIERFAVKHGADPAIAPQLAELLAACDHPRVLTAIAAKESGFNIRARGKSGEVGAFQIIPRLHGHPGNSWESQTDAAERLLNELISDSGGRLDVAVRKYNGAGPKAIKYARHVMSMAMSI